MPADGDERLAREALVDSFRRGGLPDDGGYSAAWVWVKVGGRSLPLMPNIASRRAAVRYHDLHHLMTGYDTSWRGEVQISAFEVASGCGRYWVGWVLDVGVLPLGLILAPRAMFRAFCRGRRSGNLFGDDYQALLSLTVAELQRRAHLARPAPTPRVSDYLCFLGWLLVATVMWAVVPALFLALL